MLFIYSELKYGEQGSRLSLASVPSTAYCVRTRCCCYVCNKVTFTMESNCHAEWAYGYEGWYQFWRTPVCPGAECHAGVGLQGLQEVALNVKQFYDTCVFESGSFRTRKKGFWPLHGDILTDCWEEQKRVARSAQCGI